MAVLQRSAPRDRSEAQSKPEGKRPVGGQEVNGDTSTSVPEEPAAKKVKLLQVSDEQELRGEGTAAVDVDAEEEPVASDVGGTFKEDPYTFVSPTDSIVESCVCVPFTFIGSCILVDNDLEQREDEAVGFLPSLESVRAQRRRDTHPVDLPRERHGSRGDATDGLQKDTAD